MNRDEMIEEIVRLEWEAFDKARNEGGRASCQNDWDTFSIMRQSQYQTWTDELLASYLADLRDATARGWNMIAEKYGRMEEYTAPEAFAKIKDILPPRSDAHRAIVDQIAVIQVQWMEEFAAQYPRMAGNARSIHASEDTEFNTSYETYLKGELGTYSDATLKLYGRFVVELYRKGANLARLTMENTARLYGYADLDAAEAALEKA
ncbi:MAG: DUF4125 family protein [Clostridia bacterium]|nr:DUF4125 family protein [Clostridia bacterium]